MTNKTLWVFLAAVNILTLLLNEFYYLRPTSILISSYLLDKYVYLKYNNVKIVHTHVTKFKIKVEHF